MKMWCSCYMVIFFLTGAIGQDLSTFICTNGDVISLEQVCNGVFDCPDESDEVEHLCFHIFCPDHKFRCNYGACIDMSARCDGRYQCADFSDENQCGGVCKEQEFQCDTQKCIPSASVCDGVSDCLDNSDENSEYCVEYSCPADSYRCHHGGCIHLDERCDGYKNCLDGSDESEVLCQNLQCASSECNQNFCPPIFSKRIIATCEVASGESEGAIPCDRPLPAGTIAHYECKDYYVPATKSHIDNTEMLCQPDGTWNREILQCKPECGKSDSDALPTMVNGWEAKPEKFPWHATLYALEEGNWSFKCGGSLISENVVLTAAHCTWKMTKDSLRVALGKFHSNYSVMEEFTEIINVSNIIQHPLYQDLYGNYGSDISVIILEESVEFNEYIKPICIDWTLIDIDEHLNEASIGMIAGLGLNEDDTYSETLHAINLIVVSNKRCMKEQTRDFKKYITFTSFCAGWRNGTSVCNGDSGGGLVFPTKGDYTRWVLQGIVSVSPRRKGTSFCDTKHFTVFTKVGIYVEWLQDVIKDIHEDEQENVASNFII